MRDGGSRLETGWTALRRGDWVTARDLFEERLGGEPEDPEALDGLGRALWWLGETAVSIERRREAYVIHRQQGNVCAAANIATYLAAEGRIAGEMAAANGWLARAERLLEDKDQCPERGWLEIEKAKRSSQEPREHERHARNAVKIGQTLNDHDLEVAGLSQLGLAKVDAGQVEEGLALLDESMTIATAEASDPLAIGDTCCTTLVASDRLADLVELVGVTALPPRERVSVLAGRLLREGAVQQNALSPSDAYSTPEKTAALVEAVLTVIDRCVELVDSGARADAVEAVDFTPLLRAREEAGPGETAPVAAARDTVLARLGELS